MDMIQLASEHLMTLVLMCPPPPLDVGPSDAPPIGSGAVGGKHQIAAMIKRFREAPPLPREERLKQHASSGFGLSPPRTGQRANARVPDQPISTQALVPFDMGVDVEVCLCVGASSNHCRSMFCHLAAPTRPCFPF